MNESLEQLYQEARSALKAKNYERSSELLKQILVVDENYKDASRLLARIVREKRRRWYYQPALWGTLGVLVLIGLGFLIASRIPKPAAIRPLASTITATFTSSPAVTSMPTQTQFPAPTSIPLAWKRINVAQFITREQITAIAVDPKDHDVVYAGTEGAGVYKSIDGGISWQPAQNGMGGADIYNLVIDPKQPDTLYASVYAGGLYKTTDGGANWFSCSPEFSYTLGDRSIIVIDPSDHQHLYYALGSLFESKDGGKTWLSVTSEGTCPNLIGALLLDPADQSIYESVLRGNWDCTTGIYRLDENGGIWRLVGLKNVDQITGLYMGTNLKGHELLIANDADQVYVSSDQWKTSKTQATSCNTMAVDPETTTTFYCAKTNGGLAKSTDGGSSWTSLQQLKGETFTAISVLAGGSPRLVAGGTKVAISADQGTSWNNYDNGLPGTQVDLAIDPSNASVFYLNYTQTQHANINYTNIDCHPLYRSMDAGHTWSLVSSAGCGLTFGPGGKDLYRTDDSGGSGDKNLYRNNAGTLLHSTDQGVNWDTSPMPACNRVFANPFVAGELTGFCGWAFINTHDFGRTWRWSTGVNNDHPMLLAHLYFGGNDGQRVYSIGYGSNYRSDDGGKTLELCSSDVMGGSTFNSSSSDSRLIIDPQNPDHILQATQSHGVLTSTDGCWSWIDSNTGLGNLIVNSLASDPKDFHTIYAGTDGGAYVSFNGGQIWGQINDGLLGATVVYSIVVDKDSNVYAATPYGIFKLATKQ